MILGASMYDTSFVARLTQQYDVTWSTHTHGPQGANVTMADLIAYTMERKNNIEAAGSSGPVTDHNGNFDMPDLDQLASVGFATLSADKVSATQFPPNGYYLNPWCPSDVSPHTNETAWVLHDRFGDLIFIPGTGSSVIRYKFQLRDMTERYLTSALASVQPGQINAYTMVDYVDHFFSTNNLSAKQYIRSPEFQQDLDYYDELFKCFITPLVQSNYIIWATIPDIQAHFEAWECTNCPAR